MYTGTGMCIITEKYTRDIREGTEMRTNVVIDDELMAQALASTGLKTKRAVIDEALRALVALKAQESVRQLRGRLSWEGNLNDLREGRVKYVDS